ncbi:MAG: RNase adapter protein RapZ [Actinomycetota bacterium]|nr:RNase adapter protein RapZ [Actinomycetota bacterium]MDQ1665971.1 RNase adapter protein RapZ [Actinomycetota bacterium]MDQ1670752.1 RNase adapter protein RapZ [Actinomycetota bacterium]
MTDDSSAGVPGEVPHLPELVIITGMSGAGRSTAANVLEDLGWFVVDNLPPALLPTLAELGGRAQGNVPRIAAVVDVRSGSFFADLTQAIAQLTTDGSDPRVVFLEARDDALVRRFEGVRRPHPLQGEGRLIDGIARERELMRDLRADADTIIDTSDLNVHQLSAKVLQAFEETDHPGLHATLISFGYKYGTPADADLVLDCRFLPNPHWVPELRPLTGRDAAVSDYVLGQEGAPQFVDGFAALLDVISAGYLREGKRYATIAIGCTGGKHRSVAITEELSRRLTDSGMDVAIVHRDLGRE